MSPVMFWVWLNELHSLSTRAKLLALEHFGAPDKIYYADAEEYRHVEGLLRPEAEALWDKSLHTAERALDDCERLGLRVLTLQDADYPVRLRNIYEPPCLLYVKGRLPAVDEEVAVAVVGTRGATAYGLRAAESISYDLAKQGALIVSGAARGIDSAAHWAALRAGARTVAVLGNGIDVVYPRENAALYDDIAASGALLSEYAPGTAPEAWHFPVRNRILSGLCVGTLVVEADERSGALITAGTALEQGRDVFAVPGPIDAPASRGCNRLIADGAGLVTCGWDILREYQAAYPHKLRQERPAPPPVSGHQARQEERERAAERAERQKQEAASRIPALNLRQAPLSGDQRQILLALRDNGAMQADDLIEAAGLPTRRVLSALTMLQLDGYVREESGRHFSLTVELLEE